MSVDLKPHGIQVEDTRRNLTPSQLYEEAIRHESGTRIANTGALVAYSGDKTGRSPKDKRIVRRPESERDVWWGPVNVPLDPPGRSPSTASGPSTTSTRASRLYCFDGFAGWDPAHRIKVRVICEPALSRPVHAHHAHPADAGRAGNASASPTTSSTTPASSPPTATRAGMTSKTSVDLSLRGRRGRHPRHRVRRRDEEGRLHDHELPDAEAGRPLDALLGHGRPGDRPVVDPVRPVGHRQDDALGRPEAPAHRRRRALLDATRASSTSKGAATPRRST